MNIPPEALSAFITIIVCNFFGAVTIVAIPIIIIKARKDKRQEEAEVVKEVMEIKKRQIEKENPGGINKNRLVRCEYCGLQSRFGSGKCKNCGAELVYSKI